ncbi:MAG: carboxypeptidase-like regulatory domain-containing protein, partial [Phaeodactylibacter sp.]|nr:carboxypeptidase-like regulatory domain-containing protein [Phaeodactylibacter sp.]
MKKQAFFTFIFCLAGSLVLSAQTGKVAGKVIEAESGFEVIGGNVLVVGQDGVGTVTDLDGTYLLELEAGTYTIEYSYIGFAAQQITDVEVKAGELTSVDVQLGEEAIELDLGVTVKAKAYRNTEAALLTIQKKAPGVLDGISSAQITKSGDSDVASAVRRVTGVTVEGGKYVYIRGLGDRYSKTTLNSAEIPGLDPNRNTVQMDLFPTNLIDNIVVYKTFTPNLPGDFSGGYVDIATKDFPEQFTLKASVSLGYNPISNFNADNYLTSPSGAQDALGFDDGTRAAPELATNTEPIPEFAQGLNNAANAQSIADITRSFPNTWSQNFASAFLDYGASFSIGNQMEVFGKPLGLIFALSYSRDFSANEEAEYGIYELLGTTSQASGLTPQLVQDEKQGTASTLWGAMLS